LTTISKKTRINAKITFVIMTNMSKKLKKVCLLFTGGTIAMARKSDGSLAPAHSVLDKISKNNLQKV